MTKLRVAIVLIEQAGRYILQRRGTDPRKGAAGLIGGFGGKIIEKSEAPRHAAWRELLEETSLDVPAARLETLGEVSVVSDYKLKTVEVHITAFLLKLTSSEVAEAREGSIIRLTKTDALKRANELTPGTKACFETLVKEI